MIEDDCHTLTANFNDPAPSQPEGISSFFQFNILTFKGLSTVTSVQRFSGFLITEVVVMTWIVVNVMTGGILLFLLGER